MKTELPEIIYRGTWQGLGKMYNMKVENGYTTIIVKPGQDLKQRAEETREKFVGKAKPVSRSPA
jgi:hypothetical protein